MSKDVYNFTREDFKTVVTKIIRAAPIEKHLYDGLIKGFHAIIDNHLDLIIDGKKIPKPGGPEKGPGAEEVKSDLQTGSETEPAAETAEKTGEGEVEPEEEKKPKDPNSGPSSLEG